MAKDNLFGEMQRFEQQLREEEKTIPQMGLVSSQPQTAKEYYTPAEVDRLSEQELRDPGVMAAVRWSMTKWKQH